MASRTVKRTGREQRRRTATARARHPSLDAFYATVLPPLLAGEFDWRVQLVAAGRPAVPLGPSLETFTWQDDGSAITGNLQVHRPDPIDPSSLPITSGQLVRCSVRWSGGVWVEVWTMRTKPPQWQLDTNTGSVDLEDDMALLKRSKRNWLFRVTKRRRFGYLPQELTLIVARQLGLKVRRLARGTHRIAKLSKPDATGLDVLTAIWAEETNATKRKFVIRLRDGQLEVVPFARNPLLYVLGAQLQQALVTQVPKSDQPATVLTGHARIGKGSGTRKITYTHIDRPAQRRLGYVHQDKDYGRLPSVDALRRKVKLDLAGSMHVDYTADVTVTGIPFVYRGDGVMLNLAAEGFVGDRAFVYVTTGQHTVSGTDYTSEMQFTATDPYSKPTTRATREAQQRAAKRTKRGRKA